MTSFKYRADIDGLRAVAVVLVLLFHAGFGFSGGFIGVDVFFVISGFLITGLILKEQDAGGFRLSDFWLRRLRRIVPAVSVMALLTLVAGGFLLLPGDYKLLAESTLAQQLMLSNVFFWDHIDYFAGPAEEMPLLHTWSLAVEEQFYLFYPFLLIFLNRFTRMTTATCLVCLSLLSLVACEVTMLFSPQTAFYFLPMRAWEMLLGGLLCFAPSPQRLRPWQTEAISMFGIVGIFASAILFTQSTRFPGLNALIPCVAAGLLIYANTHRPTSVGRVLSLKPIVFIGLISYSLYLWHWPLLAFSRYWLGMQLPIYASVSALVGSFILAYLSWRFVETPFRKSKTQPAAPTTNTAKLADKLPGKFRPVWLTAGSVAVIASLAGGVVVCEGISQRFSEDDLRFATYEPVDGKYWADLNKVRAMAVSSIGPDHLHTSPEIDFLVWGDSHGQAIGPLVDSLAQKHQLHGKFAAQSATVPVLNVWQPGKPHIPTQAWNDAVFAYLSQHRIERVILVGRWAIYLDGHPDGNLNPLVAHANSQSTNPAEAKRVLESQLAHTIGQLNDLGVEVWVLGQVPYQPASPPKELTKAAMLKQPLPAGVSWQAHCDRQRNVNDMMQRLQQQCDFTYIDPSPHCFDNAGLSRIGDTDGSYYRDDNHVTVHGSQQLLTPVLDQLLAEIATSVNSQQRYLAKHPNAEHQSRGSRREPTQLHR